MNKNVKIAKELVKLAKNLIALDEEGDGGGFQFYHDQENHEQEMLDLAQKQGKKYILHHKDRFGLWRIQACKDFINKSTGKKIRKGDGGGLIKSEKNLSHEGSCWVDHQQIPMKEMALGKYIRVEAEGEDPGKILVSPPFFIEK